MNTFFQQWSSIAGVVVSVEDNVVDAKGRELEIEKEYYVHLGISIDELAKMSSRIEDQEQWSKRNRDTGAQIRVRRSIERNVRTNIPSYVLTFKGPKTGITATESNAEIDAQFFYGFKDFFADNGMVKTRYSIPFKHNNLDLVWEVDVYEGTDWVKVDLELPSEATEPPKDFPFAVQQVIPGGRNDKRTGDEQEQLDKLYDNYFIAKPSEVKSDKSAETK